MNGGHLVAAEDVEGGRVDPEDPRRLVVDAALCVEASPAVHQRRDAAVDGLVPVHQLMDERRQVHNEDHDGHGGRP